MVFIIEIFIVILFIISHICNFFYTKYTVSQLTARSKDGLVWKKKIAKRDYEKKSNF